MSIRVLATTATMLAGLTGGLVLAASPAAAAVVGSAVFTTPGTTTWTVPAGVNGAVFTVDGGAGGAETTYLGTTTLGGKGGQATGFLAVTPGETFTITVGAAGQDVQGWYSAYANGGSGGLPGGGNGGGGTDPGGGGGGASWVVLGSGTFLVGGGGGGATGAWSAQQQSSGGDGGGLAGSDGSWVDTDPRYGSAHGGTQTQGGAGAHSNYNTGETGGGFSYGGTGASAPTSQSLSSGGGGGGAGWYGGGGGGTSGGAGGSSYVDYSVLDSSTQSGVKGGNGMVSIDYGVVDGVAIDQNAVPHAAAGVAYSHTFTASGWPAPSFTPVGGSLPAGLQLSADGVLSGTLTKAGTYAVTIGAYNTETFVSRQVQLVVDPGPPAAITTGVGATTGGSGTVQAGGAATLEAAVTDSWGNPVPNALVEFDLPATGPWTFLGGPKQIFVDTAANGQATAYVDLGANLGTFDATVSVPGAPSATDAVTVVPAPGGMDGGGIQPGGLLGKSYDDTLSVFGVPSPSVTVVNGTLPRGLTLSGQHISGTPTRVGAYAFTLRIDNGAASGPVDVPCSITISRTPTVGIAGGGVAPPVPNQLFQFAIPVTLSAPSAVPVVVHWATKRGTATAPRDFVAAQGDVTIPAGDTSGSVPLQVRGHQSGLASRTFSVVLTSPSNARILAAGRTATCTIYYN